MRVASLVFFVAFAMIMPIAQIFAYNVEYGLGAITDMTSDGTHLYYFEVEKGIESATWIPDTKIKISDSKTIYAVSENLFIYPTEMVQDDNHLYFASLSDDCIGQITCDYQDIYKVSKDDRELTMLVSDLRSSVHISLDDNFLYVSESSGNIWQISKHDGAKKLIIKANEIIMDVTVKDGKIYWIEERADRNSVLLTIDGTDVKVLAENLEIPYDLTIQNGNLYWSEIQARIIDDNFAEFTAIKMFDGKITTVMEFENTSPISTSFGRPNYGPYLVFDDYVFLVNNTDDESVIHMMNMRNSTKYDVGTTHDYDAKYLRTDGASLFVIGKNEQGFVIDTHHLPVVVPEFPTALLLLPLALTPILILRKFWHS